MPARVQIGRGDHTHSSGLGRVYLFCGPLPDGMDRPDADVEIEGPTDARVGHVSAAPGDADGDGADDLLFGTSEYDDDRGRVWVL